MRPPDTVTVDQAAERLGVSRREVIALIGHGRLTWTLDEDKKVLVEIPAGFETCPQPIFPAPEQPRASRLPAPPAAARGRTVSRTEGRAITDVEAWAQPK